LKQIFILKVTNYNFWKNLFPILIINDFLYKYKDKGSDFVDSVNYIEYGTSLKIKVSLAYPILKNTITNINEITNFDFSRMIIITELVIN